MRLALRLIGLVAAAAVVVAGLAIGVPVAVRGVTRHAETSVANSIQPLTNVTELGSTVYAADGKTVIATLQAAVTRVPVRLDQVSRTLVHAVLDTEDHRFYQHGGIDFPSALRALLHNSSSGGLQGGSTITQQLVKNLYTNDKRNLARKIKEAVLSNRLQKHYTKNQILDAYLNTVYLGNGAYGVEAAAKAYWGKKARYLGVADSALLAGLIQAPSGYDPISNPAAARIRRTEVLGRMLVYHDITQQQYRQADRSPLPTHAAAPKVQLAGVDGYYVREVINQLLDDPKSPLGATFAGRYAALFEGGLKITTNLDPTAQAKADAAVLADTPANSQGYEQNLVAIDPTTGGVRAMIAGQSYTPANSENVITQGERQPGSGFKIFTLLAGLEAGQSIYDKVDASAPCAIPFPGNTGYLKNPAHNDEGDGQQGVTTVLNATAQSLNCGYLRMAHDVGLPAVVAMAERLGIAKSEIGGYTDTPSMVIGTATVKPIEMADAYATLASGGTYHAPSFINHIVDRSGAQVYAQPTGGRQVLAPNVVAQADSAFSAVVQYGTGTKAAQFGRVVAGKTGTTSGPTDAWFNGYTPQLETTVWMGNPKGGKLILNGAGVYGGTYPAQTVHDFMAADLTGAPALAFPAVDYATLPPTRFIPEVTGATPSLAPPTTYYGGYYPGTTVGAGSTTTVAGGTGTTTATTAGGTTGSTTPSTTPTSTRSTTGTTTKGP